MNKVYIISSLQDGEYLYKIGRTKRDPQIRLKELRTGNCSEMEIVQIFESKWAPKIEAALQRRYSFKKISGEWFRLDDEDLETFKDNCQLMHDNFECLMESDFIRNSNEFKRYN